MMTTEWPLQRDCAEFYGDPDGGDGRPDSAWEAVHLRAVIPPWQMVLAWDTKRPIKRFFFHRKCIEALQDVLATVWDDYGQDQAAIEAARLHLFGGAYNFRLMRGGTRLSMHSYGCALDLDPENNPLGRGYTEDAGMIPMSVVARFEAAGAVWGGRWHRPDCQHVQFARVR